MSHSLDSARDALLVERTEQLEELRQRRFRRLHELYHLIKHHDGTGVFYYDENVASDEGLDVFLKRFNLEVNPTTGSIVHLSVPLDLDYPDSETEDVEIEDVEEEVPTTKPEEEVEVSASPEARQSSPAQEELVDVERVEDEEVDEEPSAEAQPGLPEDEEQGEDSEKDIDGEGDADGEDVTMAEDVSEEEAKSDAAASDVGVEEDDREENHASGVEHAEVDEEVEVDVQEEEDVGKEVPTSTQETGEDENDELDIISTTSRRSSRAASKEPTVEVEVDAVTTEDVQEEIQEEVQDENEEVMEPSVHEEEDVDMEEVDKSDAEGVEELMGEQEEDEQPVEQVVEEVDAEAVEAETEVEVDADVDAEAEAEAQEIEEAQEAELSTPPPTTPRPRSKSPILRVPPFIAAQVASSSVPLSPPPSPPPPVLIRVSSNQDMTPPNDHLFDFSQDTPVAASPRVLHLDQRFKKPSYTVPPLTALPSDFNRKGKPKQRKRDKEKNATTEGGKKEEWAPMSMARWAATLRANPSWKRVAKASKYVSSREWNTALTELRLIRVFERIEMLKDAGRWSFRQPKKQRGVGGLAKTHWDYLLDEMRWLQVDFREERRWKIVVAFELANSAYEWHLAKNKETRIALGICKHWQRPVEEPRLEVVDEHGQEPSHDHVMDEDVPESTAGVECLPDLDRNQSREKSLNVTPIVVDAEVEAMNDCEIDLDESKEHEHAHDVLNTTDALAAAIDGVDATVITEKEEPVSDEALQRAAAVALQQQHEQRIEEEKREEQEKQEKAKDSMEVDDDAKDKQSTSVSETPNPPSGLKDQSNDPTLNSQPEGQGQGADTGAKGLLRPADLSEVTKSARNAIRTLPLNAFAIDVEDLLQPMAALGTSSKDSLNTQPEMDMTSIFPELQTYTLLDVASSDIITSSDGKKKSDRRGDKDDPTKRTEETTYTRINPAGLFMRSKPTLVSVLQPARKWRKGKWINLDESPVVSDVDSGTPVPSDESSSDLFERRGRSVVGVPLSLKQPGTASTSAAKDQTAKRPREIPWSIAEDNSLKNLVEKYPHNWMLIAETLNGTHVRTRADRRGPFECYERFRTKYGARVATPAPTGEEASTSAKPPEPAQSPVTPTAPVSQVMMTRGIKRAAGTMAQAQNPLTVNTTPTVESRKRRRHYLVFETMRKVAKKRETHIRSYMNARKQIGPIHDTHKNVSDKKYTPQELSRMKSEKDSQEMKRSDELRRQHTHYQRLYQQQGPQAAAAQLNGNRIPVSISQQQRVALGANAGQLSPSMVLQAQQQARALAQAQAQVQAQAQAQVQAQIQVQAQAQAQAQAHMQNQLANSPRVPVSLPNASSPPPHTPQQSPPRTAAAPPALPGGHFPRPPSAQRNIQAVGTPNPTNINGQVMIPGNPIARQTTTNTVAAYLAALGGQQTQEQLAQFMRARMAQTQHPHSSGANGLNPPQ